MLSWAPLRRCGHCSTAAIRRPATGSAGGCRSPATSRPTTCRWRSTARACSAWARELASAGRHRDRLSRCEYGGKGVAGRERDRVRDARVRRPVAAGQVRRAVRALRRRDPAPRHRSATTSATSRDLVVGRAARLLRDDRDRPRLQRAGARHDRDLRRRDARSSSIHTPDDDARKDYIGNAAARRPHGASSSPSSIVGGEDARRARAARADPRRGRRRRCPASASRTAAPSSASTASTTAGSGSTACGSRARTCSTATPTVADDGTYFSPIENPTKRFFTMLGTLIQGRVSVGGAAINATQGRADDRRPVRAASGASSAPPGASEEALLLDYRTHQRRLLPAAGHDLRAALRPGAARRASCTRCSPTEDDRRARAARAGDAAPRASRRSPPGTRRETIQECREACGGAGYLRANRFAALKADTDVFTTFEGDNTVLLQLVAKGLLTDYTDEFGELDPLGHGAVRRRPGGRDVAERTACASCSSSPTTLLPGARRRRRTCSTASTSSTLFRWREEHMLGGRRAAAEARHRRRARPVRGARRLPGPRDRGRPRVGRPASCSRRSPTTPSGDEPVLRQRCCDLYALRTIEADRGWFQEHGRLSGGALEGRRSRPSTRCARELRPHARELVDAFGVPENALGDARVVAERSGSPA